MIMSLVVLEYNQQYKSSNNNQENRFGFTFYKKTNLIFPRRTSENNTHHKIQNKKKQNRKKSLKYLH